MIPALVPGKAVLALACVCALLLTATVAQSWRLSSAKDSLSSERAARKAEQMAAELVAKGLETQWKGKVDEAEKSVLQSRADADAATAALLDERDKAGRLRRDLDGVRDAYVGLREQVLRRAGAVAEGAPAACADELRAYGALLAEGVGLLERGRVLVERGRQLGATCAGAHDKRASEVEELVGAWPQ